MTPLDNDQRSTVPLATFARFAAAGKADPLVMVDISPRMLLRSSKWSGPVERWIGAGPIVGVRRAPYAPQGKCYWNVQKHCDNNGGNVALGWSLHIEPGFFIQAIHHANWLTPDGELVDIRQLDDGDAKPRSTFILDPTPLEFLRTEAGVLIGRPRQARYLRISSGEMCDRVCDHMEREAQEAHRTLFTPILPRFAKYLLGRNAPAGMEVGQ